MYAIATLCTLWFKHSGPWSLPVSCHIAGPWSTPSSPAGSSNPTLQKNTNYYLKTEQANLKLMQLFNVHLLYNTYFYTTFQETRKICTSLSESAAIALNIICFALEYVLFSTIFFCSRPPVFRIWILGSANLWASRIRISNYLKGFGS